MSIASGPILITGVTGQVGGALATHLAGRHILTPRRSELDLGSPDSMRSYVRAHAPAWILSCAAYTAVDAAEADREAAFSANATAPGILAEEARRLGAAIVHLSTDYVFDGSGATPRLETDPTGPLNVYGASKLAGEQAIAATGATHIILRTSWVYSATGKNFVRTMLRLLSTRTEPLSVVADQHGAPTSAADLVKAIAGILAWAETHTHEELKRACGIYHCAGAGETTWAGLAIRVRDYLVAEHGLQPPAIIPVPSAAYPTPAARPLNSRLNCAKLCSTFGVSVPEWESSVDRVCRTLTAADLPPAP